MINYSIRGENIEVTEALKTYVQTKVDKIQKYFAKDSEIDVRVNLKVYREKTAKVEVTVLLDSLVLRAEDVSQDMYGSIDLVVDKISRQIRKNKTKLEKRTRSKGKNFFSDLEKLNITEEVEDKKVVKSKQIVLQPMTLDEAILQLDLIDHDFYAYKDKKTATVNVLYKREDGELGLLELN